MDVHALDLFAARTPDARHVSRHGRPAESVPYGGLPAYESETGALYVMEALVVFAGDASHPPMLLPRSYEMAAARTQGGGLTALHDDPDAVWSWRPCLYTLGYAGTQGIGSQNELEYRRGLWEVAQVRADHEDRISRFIVEQALTGPDLGRARKNARKRLYRRYTAFVEAVTAEDASLPFVEARERADRILREHLTPQQTLELAATGAFCVRGTINRLYRVRVGNGFEVVDPTTHEATVSFCLHPEDWIPHADVALATKLAIDSGPEGEAEVLAAANPTVLRYRRRPLPEERRARTLEERYLLYP